MSAESAAVTASVLPDSELRRVQVLRYALGSSLAMALAMGFAWQLSYLTPVLALSFLGTPAPRPGLGQGIAFVAVVAVACMVGLALSRFLLPYPWVFVPFTGFLLFRLFYAKLGGISPFLITFLMIAILVIPILGMMAPGLANLVAMGLVTGAAMTIAVVWLTYGLLPDPVVAAASAPAKPSAVVPPEERLRSAVISTLVVVPVFVLFYTLQLTGSVLILIFVALLSMQPSFAVNFKAGAAMIVGNVIGGVAAILFYEILVIVPEFWFLLILTLLFGLVFGSRVYSGKPSAPLYGMAFSTVLLVIGSTTSGDGEAGAKVYTRVVQIVVAVTYVVVAFGLIERLRKARGT